MRASKSRPTSSKRPLSSTRVVRSASSCARSPATVASSRSITSGALPSTSERGSVAWLDNGRALGPLRALSAEALGVPDCYHADAALAAAICPALEVLGAGSAGAGCSGAAAALGSGHGGACGSGSTGALGSGALSSGAGAGLGTSGRLWSPAASLGSLKANKG
ncbi:uncharacterized protein LOC133906962 [Phragmites australis]|uniref:uncharacterized protein LOC133906962 n=1 Tax=Phragmites australis TaxID=29695 RepID=UPI002D78624E|nr:uncharacterized protein LOC133906962 [Phragmites australis]